MPTWMAVADINRAGVQMNPRSEHPICRRAASSLPAAVETYHLLSQRWFTHASPTLFNAGTPRPQLSSCFLVCMKNDSIEGAGAVFVGRCCWVPRLPYRAVCLQPQAADACSRCACLPASRCT